MADVCVHCSSPRMFKVCAYVGDTGAFSLNGVDYTGYVPDTSPVGRGDYINFVLCLNCGRVKGDFPCNTELTSTGPSADEFVTDSSGRDLSVLELFN